MVNRVILGVMTTVIGAAAIYIASSLTELNTAVAVQNETISNIEKQLEAVNENSYTYYQAAADQRLLHQQIERLETWVQNLSNRLHAAEERLMERTTND